MRIIRDFAALPSAQKKAVLALGNFDGLHRGHQHIIAHAKHRAQQAGVACAVMTFEPHPRRVFNPALAPLRIYPLHEKLRLFAALGVDIVFLQRFTASFARTTASAFVEDVLLCQCKVSEVVTGDNFTFGYQRGGNATVLAEYAASSAFQYHQMPAIERDGQICSSSSIREALSRGDIRFASELLGRPYHISGVVQHGDKRGRQIGFPTANILPQGLYLPRYGVYASRLHVLDAQHRPRRTVSAVTNLGVRPTFAGEKCLLETHCFDFDDVIYSERVNIELVEFIRPEVRFDGIDALKEQINHDTEMARRLLANKEDVS